MAHKFRQELRLAVGTPIPALVMQNEFTTEGVLFDVGENSMGIVVVGHFKDRGLKECVVEICDNTSPCCFRGELRYVAETDYGLRLGISLYDENDQPLLVYLDSIGANIK
ncbi:hypothetical protein [Gallaecimonas mangrovi]|uniref:hypothetical protein n=1 Tax=Gallaecimonas mangrovi TaxID=2291597 RepID=UPI000E207187|nr:hypothetical protein [Gallaecimonas mangrovi]